jgi:DNA-binding SARP family transcriptional activator
MSGCVIELKVLGDTGLAGVVGPQASTMLRRPKTLALLTYLLVAQPRGYHRREELLGLFWPERRERSRHALRQALHELRRDLGAVIETRGADEIAIDASQVWCDAVAFDDALQQDDLARAVSLCRGELLSGISMHAVSFELKHWLTRERARYREEGGRAACTLAEHAAAQSDWTAAARWATVAERLAPLDEVVLFRLLRLYRSLGYRAGAEQLYRLFEQRLKSEFALEPSEQTQILIGQIRGTHSDPLNS